MASPCRCPSTQRLHRDPSTVAECHRRRVAEAETALAKLASIAHAVREPAQVPMDRTQKDGRGYSKKQPCNSPSVSEVEEDNYLSQDSSPIVSRPFGLGALLTPDASQETQTHQEETIDNRMACTARISFDRLLAPHDSPQSTILVPETVYNDTPSVRNGRILNFSPLRNARLSSSSISPSVSPATDPEIAAQTSSWCAETDIHHAQRSRALLVEDLNNTTGLVNRLRTRNDIHEANAIHNGRALAQAQWDKEIAWEVAQMALREERKLKARVRWAIVILVLGVLAYLSVCWVKAPEMEYVRKRRVEVWLE